MNPNHTKSVSKFLSLVLRHQPELIGLRLDDAGWANTTELLAKAAAHGSIFTRTDLEEIVANNDKQRFAFSEDRSRIRASQGHSVPVTLGLEAQVPPELLFHGTVAKFLDSIRKEGLQKMSRQQLHLSADRETAHKVGSRRGSPVIITVRSGDMHREGHAFFLSENGVWLTDSVLPPFIDF